MRATCSVFIAVSLDGFISRPDGRIDWLEQANSVVPEGEDCGYGALMASVDVLVMGRNSFEQVLAFDTWPYGNKAVHVLSNKGVSIPAARASSVTTSKETPEALVARLTSLGARRLYIDGGLTIQSFLAAGLIDDLTITVIPVLIGVGKPLFGPLPKDVALTHEATKAYGFGFVQHRYRIKRSPATM